MPAPPLESGYGYLSVGWSVAVGWGTWLTFGQTQVPSPPAGVDASHWTAFGLLTSVLLAVGAFLRWYLPHRDAQFTALLAEQRDDFIRLMAEQRTANAELLAAERMHHKAVLELFRDVAGDPASTLGRSAPPKG